MIKKILLEKASATCKIHGWITSVRQQKHTTFFNINDGSNLEGLQAVISTEKLQQFIWEPLQTGCSVALVGQLVALQGRKQSVELAIDSLQLIGGCDPEVGTL